MSAQDGLRRDALQQLPRAPPSYDHRHAAMPPYDRDPSNPWTSHHAPSFSPPKLPPPRNTSTTNGVRYPYREPAPHWNSKADAPGPSPRDARFEDYGRQHAFQTVADHFSATAESSSRALPSLYPDESMSHFPTPPPPSVYARPPDASAARMRNEAYERDQVRHADAQFQSRAFDTKHSRADSTSQRSAASNGYVASSLPPPTDSRPDHFQNHHSPARHQQEQLQHSRRPSMQSHVADSSDAARYRTEASAPTWTASRPQHPAKRHLPADLEAETDPRSSALLSRPYSSSGPQYLHDSPVTSKAQTTLGSSASNPATSRLPDRHLPEREASYQPSTPRLPQPTSESVASLHTQVAAPSSAGVPPPSASSPTTQQHPLQPQRKRLRISRACDECRRRKTRCDIVGAFPGEPGHPLTLSGAVPPLEPNMEPKGEMLILQACMNCRRSEVTCSYSKRPLKRGPSKGYIKDLERRLNSLESQIVSGDRADGDAPEQMQENGPSAMIATANAASAVQTTKPKIRTEDRISRLESVLARPTSAKSEDDKSNSTDSSRRNSGSDDAHVKSEASADTEADRRASTCETSTPQDVDVDMAFPAPASLAAKAVSATEPARASTSNEVATSSPVSSRPEPKTAVSKGKSKAMRRSAASSPSRAADSDVAEIKSKVVTSFLHATFPIVPTRSEGESSANPSSSNIARLEDRVLVRGLRLLTEPVEMVTAAQEVSAKGAPTPSGAKTQSHAARVASLIGQASAGLGGPRDELALHARTGADGLRALRKVSHRLSCQEADLLMLCHLDHLRNGRNNNSALAAAVSKLGSGSHVQNDRETYRRRTLLFMLDRWHAIAFGTPHLLMGRFGMERHSFRSMKEALGDVSQSPLGDAVYEVLRCAIMLGQLNDLVQNNGGWKGISNSDVDAVIHSATDENERLTASEPTATDENTNAASSSGTSSSDSHSAPGLLSTEALRYSLESLVRCYYALHTVPAAKDARVKDLHRIFTLAESILVLGTAKTPISLQGKLVQSAIGPHVLAVAGVAFSWCLRIVCKMVASTLPPSYPTSSTSTSLPATDATSTEASTPITPTSFPLEFYRRKILDYARMCGPFCLFSGGPPTSAASIAPIYLRLALYFNSTVSFASQLGSLVSPQSEKQSPVHQDAIALGNEADNVLDMAKEMGFLGYVLAGTTQGDAWRLLTGGATASA
ncbi:uncharacterized protein UTRI_05234_B [Ustilago trichophora]|uniref:Zn(2)-C6 fungal-type domain-containing protein n=1 Tax=Ustilago trichophora TaxID=86804 RepID=A0A5C3EKG9_9BASI|nr:uncharacterized protein UTRI_05234_B [Ustilago trichophora]